VLQATREFVPKDDALSSGGSTVWRGRPPVRASPLPTNSTSPTKRAGSRC
jgi:hypothetical protein